MAPSRPTALLIGLVVAFAALTPAFAQALVVGGKNFTEQALMAELTSRLLRAKGYKIDTRTGFATGGLRKEQEAGLVDVYWEYTGTSLVAFNNVADKLDPEEAYDRVKALDAQKGLVWLTPSRVDNTYALAMRRADAAARGIASISDLAAASHAGGRVRLACNIEFYIRPDGLTPLQQAYGFEFASVVRMDADRVYDVLRASGDVDVGLVFSTDARVAAFDFLVLRDDRGFFPSYRLTPVVRQRTLERFPDLAAHLNALSAKLDNATIARLNAAVDLQKMTVEETAAGFLEESGLL
jgi:osmoprotectant transport system substrate-binding protein